MKNRYEKNSYDLIVQKNYILVKCLGRFAIFFFRFTGQVVCIFVIVSKNLIFIKNIFSAERQVCEKMNLILWRHFIIILSRKVMYVGTMLQLNLGGG